MSNVDNEKMSSVVASYPIPVKPQMLTDIRLLLDKEEPDIDCIARLISNDVVISSAAVLKIINSPFYAVTELKNMEAKAKAIKSIDGMQKHIKESVALISEIMNEYASTQSRLHQKNTKKIKGLKSKVNSASCFIEKLERELNVSQENNLVDELTSVSNRKGYVRAINNERDSWLSSGQPLSLMIIDIDKFKNINDSYGHSIGDQVIKCIGQTLKKVIRSTDHVARYGGEEFVLILPATDLDKAIILAEKIRSVVNTLTFELRKKNQTMKVTCSFGLASFTKDMSNTVEVFNAADKALYQAKESGRDAIAYFSGTSFTLVDKLSAI